MGEILRAEGISKTYHTGMVEVHALKKCDITIRKGEFTAIIGKSGSGKSTLLRILGSMDKPDEGEVYIDDINIGELNDKQLSKLRREKIGFVYQNYSLIPEYTAYENIVLPVVLDNQDIDEDDVNDLLESLQIEHCRDKFPEQMSGGEQQRVAIAIALANNPKILLADEPTGAVDTKTSNMIQDLFRKLNEELGITIIIVTHDISLANKVGRVVMIADGKISTEKIMKESYKDRMNELSTDGFSSDDSHEEYSILDKANRVQISPDILAAAGIDSNKVKVQVVDGKVIITKE